MSPSGIPKIRLDQCIESKGGHGRHIEVLPKQPFKCSTGDGDTCRILQNMCTLCSEDIRRSVNLLLGQEFLLQDCTGKLSLSSRVAICGRTDVLRCMAGSLGRVPDMDASKETLCQCASGRLQKHRRERRT